MKKTKLTRSLLAACSIVALSAVMYGCVHSGDDGPVATDVTLSGAQIGQTLEAGRYQPDAALTDAIEGASDADLAAAAGEHATDAMITLAGLDFSCVSGPCSVTVNDDGTVTTMGTIMVMEHMVAMPDPEPTPDPTAGLFAAAQDARDDATAAGKAGSDAVTAATKAAMGLTTMEVAGESMTAMTNAEAILKAQTDAGQAVTDAQDALDDAKAAKTEAEALDDTNEHKTALIAALDAAIKVAEDELKKATGSNDSDALSDAVDEVTGGEDADPQGTPTSVAKTVAEAVGEALGGMTLAAAIPRPTADPIANAAPVSTVANVVRMNNSRGKTWAQIVGEDNVQMMRVGANNTIVQVASITGKTVASIWETVPGDVSDLTGDTTATDGANFGTANYAEIPGTVHCLGTDCKVVDDRLDGSWYFQPTSQTEVYVKASDDPTSTDVDESKLYEAETLYAQFGHWLTMEDVSGTMRAQINRYALTGGNTANLEYDKVDGMPDSATYNGDAAGMSVHKTTDTDGEVTSIYSGAFTADVELVLQFGDGADATLGGTIDGFESALEGSMAVDPTWTVELQTQTTFDGSFDDGTTVATGRDGVWSATAYGPDQVGAVDQRPTGIFGGFNAHFSDGHAAGVYAAD